MEPGVLNHGGMGHMGGEGGAMAVVSAGNMFQWGKESQLSSSVPVSVISNAADFQVKNLYLRLFLKIMNLPRYLMNLQYQQV